MYLRRHLQQQMLPDTKAVRLLEDGCRRLGIPTSTATALVQFLSIKKIHDEFIPGHHKQLRMSAGVVLEQLWHWMLLNTAVSYQVYELLGGAVEYCETDESEISEGDKLLQRLYALNIMLLEGMVPDVNLWTEPGTLLSTTQLTSSKLPALKSLPGGGRLLMSPSLTIYQRKDLIKALLQLYTSSNHSIYAPAAEERRIYAPTPEERPHSPAGSNVSSVSAGTCSYCSCSCSCHSPRYSPTGSTCSTISTLHDLTHADLAAAALEAVKVTARAAQVVALSQPVTKVAHEGSPDRPQEKGTFQFYVTNLQGNLKVYQASSAVTVREFKQQVQEREGVDAETVRLVYAGKQLEDSETLGHYGVWRQSTVHLCRKLRGF